MTGRAAGDKVLRDRRFPGVAAQREERKLQISRTRLTGGRWAGAAVAVVVAGCASSGGTTRENVRYGAATSEQAVAGFLDAANGRDYDRMGRLFGTKDGPAEAEFGIAETEQRMIVISSLLLHGSYTMSQQNLAGLGENRVRYVVTLSGTRKGTVAVPVVTAPDGEGNWFVEWLELDSLAGGI